MQGCKILLAFDSFKNSLPASKIHEAIDIALHDLDESINVESIILSDGGEGFLSCVSEGSIVYLSGESSLNAEASQILGPDGTPLTSIPIRKLGNTVFMEMATTSGIELVERPDCLIYSSYGTGQAIREVLILFPDVDKIILGVGGTATSDGGIGCLLGFGEDVIVHDFELCHEIPWKEYRDITWIQEQHDDDAKPFSLRNLTKTVPKTYFTGQDLALLKDIKFTRWAERMLNGETNNIDWERLNELKRKLLSFHKSKSPISKDEIHEYLQLRLQEVDITIASDVRTPFCGEVGAVSVFSKQKGASSKEIRVALEHGMQVIRSKVQLVSKVDLATIPCSGAGGGISGILQQTLNAHVERGIVLLAKICGLEETILSNDFILTGEGKYDSQTAQGKVVEYVSELARKYNKQTIILCGQSELEGDNIYPLFPTFTLDESMKNTYSCIQKVVSDIWKEKIQEKINSKT